MDIPEHTLVNENVIYFLLLWLTDYLPPSLTCLNIVLATCLTKG